MQVRVITLRYSEGQQGFSEEALRAATLSAGAFSIAIGSIRLQSAAVDGGRIDCIRLQSTAVESVAVNGGRIDGIRLQSAAIEIRSSAA